MLCIHLNQMLMAKNFYTIFVPMPASRSHSTKFIVLVLVWTLLAACFVFAENLIWQKEQAARTYFPRQCSNPTNQHQKVSFPPHSLENASRIISIYSFPTEIRTIEDLRHLEMTLFRLLHQTESRLNWCHAEDSSSEWLDFLNAFNGEQKADCGHYGKSLSLFGTLLGARTRVLGMHEIQDTTIGQHTFTEFWIPSEKKYIYTDMTLNVLGVRKNHQYLSAWELYQLALQHDTANLEYLFIDTGPCLRVEADSLFLHNLYACFHPDTRMVYYQYNHFSDYDNTASKKRSQRYLFSAPFSYVWNKTMPTKWYWFRVGLFYLGLLSGMVALGMFLRSKWFPTMNK